MRVISSVPLCLAHVAVVAAALGFLALGCQTQRPQDALERALQPFIDEHTEEVEENVEWVAGSAQAPEILGEAEISLIDNQDDLVRIWANQGEGPMPAVDFRHEVVLAVFLSRSAATALRFHSLRYNEEEGIYEAYVLGELKPLNQVRDNHPYLLATLPVRSGSIRVHRIHIRELAEGGWEIQPFGTPQLLQRTR